MKTLYKNCTVITVDSSDSVQECMVTENGKIIYVGSLSDLPQEEYNVVDLEGKTIMPSFIDSHLHFTAGAAAELGLNVAECNSVSEYEKTIKEYYNAHPNASVIRGFGWHDRHFGPNGPSKTILDQITTDIPISILSDSCHSRWINSKTIEMAGFSKDTRDFSNAQLSRTESGDPSGVVLEDYVVQVDASIPDYSVDQYKQSYIQQMQYMNQFGFTGFFDARMITNLNEIKALKDMVDNGENLGYGGFAYYVMPHLDLQEQMRTIVEARKNDNSHEELSANTVKFILDGVVENRTAFLREPYCDNDEKEKDYSGANNWEQNMLNEAVLLASENDFQIEMHCIGDAALEQALTAYEYAKSKGYTSSRNKIAHIELLFDGALERLKNLNIVPCLNPYWAEADDLYPYVKQFIGTDRAYRIWPLDSFVREGLVISSGSDYPITEIPNPFLGIEIGVTRRISRYCHPWAVENDFESYGQLGPDDEKCSRMDMIRMFTIGSAYAMNIESITGSIEVGKNADFIITDNNVLQVETDEISNIKVLATFFKGKEIYRS